MYYYKIVFNRPIAFASRDLESLSYGSEKIIPIGVRVRVELGSSLTTGVLIAEDKDMDAIFELQKKGVQFKEILEVIDVSPILNEDQIKLAEWMAQYYISTWGECISTILPTSKAKQERKLSISGEIISHFEAKQPNLNEDQKRCYAEIIASTTDDSIRMCYLYGITGSGKTEVFLASMQEMISRGKQVIYLVPEITLVHQIYPLFCARFQEEHVAVLHSQLTPSQKLTEWKRIQSGEAHVVLGVRSAIFAPVSDLGLIVVDEEHDSSYKSGSSPRYHARQVAMKRCHQHGALLVMGSATPSLESWASRGRDDMCFMKMTQRVGGGKLPHIELVSLEHVAGCISPLLQEEIQRSMKAEKQILLLLNRRGFSHMYLCGHCGESMQCPHCSVHLTYHQHYGAEADSLLCHHCGYSCVTPETCPKCNFITMGLKGWGTQRVEEELNRLFPQTRVGRFDSDVAKDKNKSHEILGMFYRKEIDIMVGTQILAKGINFPHLNLVGILFADSLLGIPDFRAEERAFALMTQVAGRAGRFFEDGKVIVQGYGIENPLFEILKNGDYDSFFEEELRRRAHYALAPYQRILRLVFRGIKKEQVEEVATLCAQKYEEYAKSEALSCNILGPATCAIEKVANNYRYHLVLSGNTQFLLNSICSQVMRGGLKNIASRRKVYIEIDPDPLNMY